MIKKIAVTIEKSYDIPETDRLKAEESKKVLKKFLGILENNINHVDSILKFVENPELSPDDIEKYRGSISIAAEKVEKDFNALKSKTKEAIILVRYFSTDPGFSEMTNTFENSFKKLEKQTSLLIESLLDYKLDSFKETCIKHIESLKSESKVLKEIVKERIFNYIDDNILSGEWEDQEREKLAAFISKQAHYLDDLFAERENVIHYLKNKG